MSETYCGKSCDGCTYKEQLSCDGCKQTQFTNCTLANCCKKRRYDSCNTCNYNKTCSTLLREGVPEYRLQLQTAAEEKKKLAKQKAQLTRMCLFLLFLSFIPSTLANLMSNTHIVPVFSPIYILGIILEILCSVAYGLILLKLSDGNDRYHTSGICILVATAANFLVKCISISGSTPSWAVILSLSSFGLALFGTYQEFLGHSVTVRPLDYPLSEQWQKLWKWYIGSIAAMFSSIVIAIGSWGLGNFLYIISILCILGVCVIKLVYLYQSSQLFSENTTHSTSQF